MICRNCLTGYGRCVSWADVYEEIPQRLRQTGDLHWRGVGSYWVTVDQHNGVEVHFGKVRDDAEMAGMMTSLHLANEEWLKMKSQGDSYEPPPQRTFDPVQEMLRQNDLLK